MMKGIPTMSNRAQRPPIDDLWYKNAIIYCLDVEKYVDSKATVSETLAV